MYLATLVVKNYRCLKELTVNFQPGLNVILGENNTGKTALLDAIRVVLGFGQERREIYLSEDDLFHDDAGARASICEITAVLKGLSEQERGGFSACLAPSLGDDVAQIHVRGEVLTQGQRSRFRFRIWGGELEGETIPPEMLDGIRAVYLEALRDPRIGLRPGRTSRLARLVQALSSGDEESKRVIGIAQTANDQIERDDLVKRTVNEINTRLKGVTGQLMAQTAEVRLTPPEFKRITESLRALVGTTNPLDIDENGLGYNNLLYIATVLGELQREKQIDQTDLALMLVEEPEAHLHPHLQSVLIDYLYSVSSPAIAEQKRENESVHFPVQVIVTTHSPVIGSRVPLESLNVLHWKLDKSLTCFALADCGLNDEEKADLRRYLDVTKAQLFFARGVVFVEGISEALLLPEFAKILGFNLEESFVSIVNLQGLLFKSFARLFGEGRFLIPAAILTDGDPSGDVYPETLDLNIISDAAKTVLANQRNEILVQIAAKTFEYDLALAGNADRMAREYKSIHPRVGDAMVKAIGEAQSLQEKAKAFVEKFDSAEKARFAQKLAGSIAKDPAGFVVPSYIADAIRHAINGKVSDAETNS
jgi:putative ATP-dependent endonuclease of the OLD family